MNFKIKILIYFLSVLIISPASAKKWRVNNALSVPDQVDFAELKDAVDSPTVASGDTIYIEGSAQPYEGEIEVFKKLTIIGPGYFLDQPNLQPTQCNQLQATINGSSGIFLRAGSDGSYISGLNFLTFGSPVSISIENTSNVTITRNRMREFRFATSSSNQVNQVSNIIISRNLICNDILFGCPLLLNTFLITNNLINGTIEFSCGNTTEINMLNGTIINNTLSNGNFNFIRVKGCDISYNYVGSIDPDTDNSRVHHNILSVNNQDNQDIVASDNTNVIAPYDDSSFNCDSDNWTLLPPDQTTTHGAYNGGDPFYSTNPISPANLPAFPVIYECEVDPCGDTEIGVKFSIRTNQ